VSDLWAVVNNKEVGTVRKYST